MSQNQPKPPEPKKQTPQKLVPPRAAGQSGTSLQNVTQTLQQSWNQSQSTLKAQSLKALRGTIQLLEGVVEKLEAEPLPSPVSPPFSVSPSPEAFPTAIEADTVTDNLEAEPMSVSNSEVNPPVEALTASEFSNSEVTPPPVEPLTASELKAEPEPEVTASPTFFDQFLPSFDRVEGWWKGLLKQIRALLPASLNQKLSDWSLTGAIATTLVVLLWTTAALMPGKPAEVTAVIPKEIPTPSELTAPEQPEPVAIAPPPAPVLTPEQNLIAAIQNQVTEITEKYANGLIQSIQANFPSSFLGVKVSEGWYNLNPSQQDKLADEMLRRSQELDFSKLQITDPEGTVLARSPVVGTHMVILKRSTSQNVAS